MTVKGLEVDLFQVIMDDLGLPEARKGARYGERPWWLCPFHPDNNPSFTLTPDKQRFICFGCGQKGDAIDYIRKRNPGLTFHQAVARLDRFSSSRAKGRGPRVPSFSGGVRLAPLRPPPPPEWRTEARAYNMSSQKALWSTTGRDALDWLHNRGLQNGTIRAARLGYDETRNGVVIPWTHKRMLRVVNLRRLSGEPRYQLRKGSVLGTLYPAVNLHLDRPVLLCEGELDVLLVNQEAGDLVQAVTLGSAGATPTAEVLVALACSSFFFLGLDADAAGDKAARHWSTLAPRAKRLRPPKKDWTEIHLSKRHDLRKVLGPR